MRNLAYLLTICISILLVSFVSCEVPELQNQNYTECSVIGVEDITNESATIRCKINVEDFDCVTFCGVFLARNDYDLGYYYYTDDIDFSSYASLYEGSFVNEGEFVVGLTYLQKNTEYYYRAVICINNQWYTFSSIDSFWTAAYVPKPNVPDGAFSIGQGRYVLFSPGNLQYQASTKLWRFAQQQYDYIGDDNTKVSTTYNGWIDLFGWGTGNNPTLTSTTNSKYSTFIDWGSNKIGNDEVGTWRTLTSDQWNYIENERYNATNLIGIAQVAGVNGLILLPDDWNCPDGITFNAGYSSNSFSSQNIYTASKWQKLEDAGAVFLPAAGCRRNGTTIEDVQREGKYWCSDLGSDINGYYGPCVIAIDAYQTYIGIASYRYNGYSVRLVKDL